MSTTTKKPRKLTVKQLLAKFPDMEQNVNCLEDMACPQCGQREVFHIEMTSIIPMHDDGTDEHGDTDWNGNSYCQCHECGHAAKVRDFTFKNLDARIWFAKESAA